MDVLNFDVPDIYNLKNLEIYNKNNNDKKNDCKFPSLNFIILSDNEYLLKINNQIQIKKKIINYNIGILSEIIPFSKKYFSFNYFLCKINIDHSIRFESIITTSHIDCYSIFDNCYMYIHIGDYSIKLNKYIKYTFPIEFNLINYDRSYYNTKNGYFLKSISKFDYYYNYYNDNDTNKKIVTSFIYKNRYCKYYNIHFNDYSSDNIQKILNLNDKIFTIMIYDTYNCDTNLKLKCITKVKGDILYENLNILIIPIKIINMDNNINLLELNLLKSCDKCKNKSLLDKTQNNCCPEHKNLFDINIKKFLVNYIQKKHKFLSPYCFELSIRIREIINFSNSFCIMSII
jgi:hypothetical protein